MTSLLVYAGSPPRVRGKAARRHAPTDQDGITPACAGKSYLSHKRFQLCRDHPRVCGEKNLDLSADMLRMGSPPRVRGKVVFFQSARRRLQDHPRVCGEKTKESLKK